MLEFARVVASGARATRGRAQNDQHTRRRTADVAPVLSTVLVSPPALLQVPLHLGESGARRRRGQRSGPQWQGLLLA